jgi:hypothetical protein
MNILPCLPSQVRTMSHNRNPSGKNQHGIVRTCTQNSLSRVTLSPATAKADDEALANALHSYHREQLTSNKKISARLLSDHGIKIRQVTYPQVLLSGCELQANLIVT